MSREKYQPALDDVLSDISAEEHKLAGLKRMANMLCERMGDPPMFSDPEAESTRASALKPDQYYGKPLATCVQDFLGRMRTAKSVEEILKGLERGGFDFKSTGWKENDRLRSLAISLAKNSKTFHRVPNGMVGLLEWYPDVAKRQEANDKAAAADKSAEVESSESKKENGPTRANE